MRRWLIGTLATVVVTAMCAGLTLAEAAPTAPAAGRPPDLRLTVHTPDDLVLAQRVAALLAAAGGDPRLAPLRDVIAAARRLPAREVA